MRRRVLAIIMSVMVMVAFMPTMSFATDITDKHDSDSFNEKYVMPSDAGVEHHAIKAKDVVLSGNACDGKIVKHECACGATWVSYEEGTLKNDKHAGKTAVDKMSVEEAEELFIEAEGKLLDQFLEDVIKNDGGIDISKAKDDLPAFIDELNKLFLGVEFEDEVFNQKNVSDAMIGISVFMEDVFDGDKDLSTAQSMIKEALRYAAYAYFHDVEINIEAFINGEQEAYVGEYEEHCYALVSTCKECGEITAVRLVKHEGTPKADCATTYVCDECGKTVRFAAVSHFTADVAKIAKQADLVAEKIESYTGTSKEYRDAKTKVTNKENDIAEKETEVGNLTTARNQALSNLGEGQRRYSRDYPEQIGNRWYANDEKVSAYNEAVNALKQANRDLYRLNGELYRLNENLAIVDTDNKTAKEAVDSELREIVNYMCFFDNAGKHDFETTVEEKACGKIVTVSCKKCGEEFSFVVPTSILKHDYEWVTVNEADCASTEDNPLGINGLKVKKCKECGAIDLTSFTPVAPKHNFVDQVVEPTCTTYGYTVQKCADCEKYIPGTIKDFVKPLGHDYNIEMVVEPTCGNPGLLKIECKNGCHDTMYFIGDDLENEALIEYTWTDRFGNEHKYDLGEYEKVNVVEVENIKDMDAVEAAIAKLATTPIVKIHDKLHDEYLYYFVGFNRELLLNPIKLESPDGGEHNFDTWGKVEATCLHGTQWIRKCSDCGYIDVHATGDDFIENDDALGHQITKTVGKEPTCGEYGYQYYYCERCGKYIMEDEKTPFDNQKKIKCKISIDPIVDEGVKCTPADKWTTTVEATCTEAGTRVKYCTECGAICATDDIECKHHDPADEWTTLVKSTFTKAGTRVKYCNTCGEICDSDDIAMLKLGKAYQPKLSSPAKGKLKIKIKKANKYATGYQIAYKKAGGTYKFIKVNGKTPSKTITKLAKGKKYTVKVRPYRVEGKKTFYGEYSTIKTFKIK